MIILPPVPAARIESIARRLGLTPDEVVAAALADFIARH